MISRFQKHLLVEKVDLNYPVKVTSSGWDEFLTEFMVGEEKYSFEAQEYFFEDIFGYPEDDKDFEPDRHAWEVEFANISKHPGKDRWGINDLLGMKALKVFSGVATSLKKFIKSENPYAFYFSAKEPSRVKLYNTMAKLISKKIPYKLQKGNVPHANTYVFYK